MTVLKHEHWRVHLARAVMVVARFGNNVLDGQGPLTEDLAHIVHTSHVFHNLVRCFVSINSVI